MGAANKLLAELGGTAVVRRVAEAALASQARPVLVVTGHQAEAVRSALAGLDVTFVANPDFAQGLSTSLKAGLRALPGEADGALILLGDMPRIAAGDLDRLIARLPPRAARPSSPPCMRASAATPWYGRAPISRRCWNSRATPVRAGCSPPTPIGCASIDLGTDAIHADVDTPEALAELRSLSPLAGRGSG